MEMKMRDLRFRFKFTECAEDRVSLYVIKLQ